MPSSVPRTHLRKLFDQPTMTDWLRDEIRWPNGFELSGVRLARFWIGKRGKISFELDLSVICQDGMRVLPLQGRVGANKRKVAVLADAKITRHGLLGLSLTNRELDIQCCTPDQDEKIKVARRLLDDTALASLIGTLHCAPSTVPKPNLEPADLLDSKLCAYRFNRRCVMRASVRGEHGETTMYLKAYRRSPTAKRLEHLQTLAHYLKKMSAGRICSPPLVGHLLDCGLVAIAGAPKNAKPLGFIDDDVRLGAQALATLHSVTASTDLNVHTPSDELATVARWIDVLPLLASAQHSSRVCAIVDRLDKMIDTLPSNSGAPIHRDYYSAQLLRDDSRLWILDFDTLSVGHVEQDLATFCAHQWLDRLRTNAGATPFAELINMILVAYRSHGGHANSQCLRFYLPCALARLATIHAARGLPSEIVEQVLLAGENAL